jgi:ankyrin repeat protein
MSIEEVQPLELFEKEKGSEEIYEQPLAFDSTSKKSKPAAVTELSPSGKNILPNKSTMLEDVKKDSQSNIITRESSISSDIRGKVKSKKFSANENSIVIDSFIDWYGNTCLHHLFASYEVNCELVERAVQSFPEAISQKNQFGRIPLHYAVDRSHVNIKGLEILLSHYPQGVDVQDNEGLTPYHVAKKWDHSKQILMFFLNINSALDNNTYLRIKYGPIGHFAVWANNSLYGEKGGEKQKEDQIRREEENEELVSENHSNSQSRSRDSRESSFNINNNTNTWTQTPTVFSALSRSQSRKWSLNSSSLILAMNENNNNNGIIGEEQTEI